MKISKVLELQEAAYEGNIGIMELHKFYQIASNDQIRKLRELINTNQVQKAWDLIQRVTGEKLKKVA